MGVSAPKTLFLCERMMLHTQLLLCTRLHSHLQCCVIAKSFHVACANLTCCMRLQTTVGTLLNIGTHGVSRDHVAAAHYLQRAAAAGNDEAMAHLGHMYGAGQFCMQVT